MSQKEKNKYSRRYIFSGKIKCGCCGKSYVARYKTRQDGSIYKAWRCSEAAKHGAFHIDKFGNRTGCSGVSIRNEDAVYLMYLVTKRLKLDNEKNVSSLISVIKSVLKSGNDNALDGLKENIKFVEDNRHKLVELYFSGRINESEFNEAEAIYSSEIKELRKNYRSVNKNKPEETKYQTNIEVIDKVIKEIVNGVEYEDDFYRHILDKMVINDRNNIDIYLYGLPYKFSYKLKTTHNGDLPIIK